MFVVGNILSAIAFSVANYCVISEKSLPKNLTFSLLNSRSFGQATLTLHFKGLVPTTTGSYDPIYIIVGNSKSCE